MKRFHFKGEFILKESTHSIRDRPWSEKDKRIIILLIAISLIIFDFVVDTPINILKGIYHIIIHPDSLITDYLVIGGIGAAFVNSGLLTLFFLYLLWKHHVLFNGATFAVLFLIAGFSFLGKNILNIWTIITGVYFNTKYHRQSFSPYLYIALFGTAMAPIVTEIIFHATLTFPLRLRLGILLGLGIGFILPPLALHFYHMHQGFNLYHVGFSSGLIVTVLVALFKSFGYHPSSQLIWGENYNTLLSIYLYLLYFILLLIGFLTSSKPFYPIKQLMMRSGRLSTDFIVLDGFSATLINMALNGILVTTYILVVGGQLNGPTLGGIFSVIEFGAYGNLNNIIPVMIGIIIEYFIKIWSINDPSILLASLFGPALAPIAGTYGCFFGILARFLHSSVVLHIGELHAGLNLYNNGFSAGIVASILIPLIEAFKGPTIPKNN